jgi:hypothetical protein
MNKLYHQGTKDTKLHQGKAGEIFLVLLCDLGVLVVKGFFCEA